MKYLLTAIVLCISSTAIAGETRSVPARSITLVNTDFYSFAVGNSDLPMTGYIITKQCNKLALGNEDARIIVWVGTNRRAVLFADGDTCHVDRVIIPGL
jgi:hypothetical protein